MPPHFTQHSFVYETCHNYLLGLSLQRKNILNSIVAEITCNSMRRFRVSPCTITSVSFLGIASVIFAKSRTIHNRRDRSFHVVMSRAWCLLCTISAINHSFNPKIRSLEWIDRVLAHTIPSLMTIRYTNAYSIVAGLYSVAVFYSKTRNMKTNSYSMLHASMHIVCGTLAIVSMNNRHANMFEKIQRCIYRNNHVMCLSSLPLV